MHIRLIAVGDRQPTWVATAFDDYAKRLPAQWKFSVNAIATAQRPRRQVTDQAKEDEGKKILAAVRSNEFMVLLDETGKALSSRQMSDKLMQWQETGRDLCFVIGGPDGVSTACRERADFVLSLSAMTLPHGLARVMFSEQLYRAWTLTQGHPYHRD
jgi:23S rRNA (pseudouridine1915-N3)-methyltransferase